MSQQKYPKAYEAYQQAVYRDGRNPTFWCSIGVLYYQINQYRDALDAYSRAIRLNPYISEVWYDLGTLVSSILLRKLISFGTLLTTHCSMSRATTKSAMRSMRTSAQTSWIPATSTSRHACSFSEADRACRRWPMRRFRKMCTPMRTRPQAPWVRQGLNGEPLRKQRPQHHRDHQPALDQETGLLTGWRRSTLHHSHRTRTSTVRQTEPRRRRHAKRAQGRSIRCVRTKSRATWARCQRSAQLLLTLFLDHTQDRASSTHQRFSSSSRLLRHRSHTQLPRVQCVS